MDKKQENIPRKPFLFNEIDAEINDVTRTDKSRNEISIFKDFANKYLWDSYNAKNLLDGYFIFNECNIINVNQLKLSSAPSEIDLYFINKNKKNQILIFLFEVKDFSSKTLKIYKNFNFVTSKIKILKKDLMLSEMIFPMFNESFIFLRINIIKFSKNNIKYYCYAYKPSQIKYSTKFLSSYNDWKRITSDNFRSILKNSENLNFNLSLLKKNAYNKNTLKNLLDNFKDKHLITNICLSIDNIEKLSSENLDRKNRLITKINGSPGSGKTVFAFLLFITEKHVLLIVSNKKFFFEFYKSITKIKEINKNEFLLFNDDFKSKEYIDFLFKKFKFVVIDESQNIDNEILDIIAHICFKYKIQLFLLSDSYQNIYAWKNLIGIKGDNKLLEKQKDLDNRLASVYSIKENDFIFNWENSNRFTPTDLHKIKYLVFNDKNSLNYYRKHQFESSLEIDYCQESNLDKIKGEYPDSPIFVVYHMNLDSYLNEYQHLGYEYNALIIYLPPNIKYDAINKKLQYYFDERKNRMVIDEAFQSWLYVAFTRPTKLIKIFVDETNRDKYKIIKYFNDKLNELELYTQIKK